MCKRVCKIFQMPTNHNEQAAKRNILDVVDGAIKNTYVKIILFYQLGNNRFISYITTCLLYTSDAADE